MFCAHIMFVSLYVCMQLRVIVILHPSDQFAHPFQTELTIRLGLQLPFEVDYGRLQQLFYTNAMFERPGPSQVTIKETREPLPSGAGPFFR